MNINNIIKKIKNHPDYDKVGMVLYHNGIVRNTSRKGSKVKGLSIKVDYNLLNKIIKDEKKKKGIIEIIIEIDDTKKLLVGDDIMFIAVAGDIRENVISTLTNTLNLVKKMVTKKTEFLV